MTQTQLAHRAGVGKKTLKRLESGKTGTPHPETLAAVAGALGLTPEGLFEAADAFDTPCMTEPFDAPALHQLPTAPLGFRGRERELRDVLVAVRSNAAQVVAIQGMGGIGKTALALVAAEALAHAYPDGQFLLDLCGERTPASTADAMFHVIRSIEPQRRQPTTDAGVEATYRTLLRGKRCLLLLDGASNRKQVEALLPPTGSLVLLTSRIRFSLPGSWACPLTPLADTDAHALIRDLAPHAEAVVEKLAYDCGGLPLALNLAGRALAERPDLDPREYAARLADDRSRLEALDQTERDAGVQASFALSYGMLEPEQQFGLCQLSVCQAPFDRRAAAAIWGAGEEAVDAAIGGLVRFNLLESTGAGKTARYWLHDLVRLFVAAKASDEERIEAGMGHARHYLDLLARADDAARATEGRALIRALEEVDREWVHVQAAFKFCSKHAGHDPETAALCRRAASASLLPFRLTPRQRLAWLEVARGLASLADEDRNLMGHYLVETARAHQDLGHATSAMEWARRAWQLNRTLDDDQIGAGALIALGDAHYALGASAEAVDYGEQALSVARRAKLRFEEAAALVVLSRGYRVQGVPDKAVACAEEALPIAQEHHYEAIEGSAFLALAFARRSNERLAHSYAEQSLAIARKLGDRRMEGYSLLALGAGAGDTNPSYDAALELARATGDRRMEAHALLAIGIASYRGQRPRRALRALGRSYAIAVDIGNREMQSIALAVQGIALASLGEFAASARVLSRAERLCEMMRNRRHGSLVSWFLSRALEREGDLVGALRAAERVVRGDSAAIRHEFLPAGPEMEKRLLRLQSKLACATR